MRPPLRFNLLRDHEHGRLRAWTRAIAKSLVSAVVVVVMIASGARWLAGGQLDEARSASWKNATDTDLALAPESERERLRSTLWLASELEQLQWLDEWQPLLDLPLAGVMTDRAEIEAIRGRREQLRAALRGNLEEVNRELEQVVQLPQDQRDAVLRVASYGRWRLLGGSYRSAADFYDRRRADIERRPSPTATAAPTATPTRPARGRPKGRSASGRRSG